MYKNVVILVLFLFSHSSFAQTYDASPENGYADVYKNIRELITANTDCLLSNDCDFKINVEFWVSATGKVSQIKSILKCKKCYNINKISSIIAETKWKAACKNGKLIKQKVKLPILICMK